MVTYEPDLWLLFARDAINRGLVVSSYLVRYPALILPAPDRVAAVLFDRYTLISVHATTTALEIVCGLILGSILGFTVACLIGDSKRLQSITMPALIISQALPVFAIAQFLCYGSVMDSHPNSL